MIVPFHDRTVLFSGRQGCYGRERVGEEATMEVGRVVSSKVGLSWRHTPTSAGQDHNIHTTIL